MKCLILSLSVMVLLSGCASNPIHRYNFGDTNYTDFKGGTVEVSRISNFNSLDDESLSPNLIESITAVCKNGKFKFTSYEVIRQPSGGFLLFLFFIIQPFDGDFTYLLNFECLK